MALVEYRKKRHFSRTAEPAGKKPRVGKSGWRFVIQKHAARRLHYDFRLEQNGVLKSWAVPQGPCLDPSQRRLAVQVEDHPVEYGNFEGIIPAGEYGGGTVLLWDTGTWLSEQDVSRALQAGKLKFQLAGEKLKGGWNLIRMRSRPGEKKENWLLIKERDDEALPLDQGDVLEDRPESVKSGRTISEVAASADKTWTSNRENGKVEKKVTKRPRRKSAGRARRGVTAVAKRRSNGVPPGARRGPFPTSVEPELASLVDEAPAGDEWVHEIKLDGYRILAFVDNGQVTLRTRKQNDWTHRFPELTESLADLPAKRAVLDGEIVALLPNGTSEFQALQSALSERQTAHLIYYVFDLLYLDGFDLRGLALDDRKKRLAELLAGEPEGRIRYSEHLAGAGEDVVAKSCRMGLEGIVSKRRASRYVSGRGEAWLKRKCVQRQEFVIGGFTDSTSSRKGLGALLVGYFNCQGKLIYAGKVGSGFSVRSEQDLRERLKAREQAANPFHTAAKDERRSTTHWVAPQLVAEVKYSNWTRAGNLRQPVFQGLREDKPAREVVLERPEPKQAKRRPGRNSGQAASRTTPRSRKEARPLSLTSRQREELAAIQLTHPDRVLYPDLGLTKRDLVTYYAQVSEWMLPHVMNRPLSFVRCPEGQTGPSFFQKHAAAGTPVALRRVMIEEKHKAEEYLVIENLAGLLSVVQLGILEIHTWGATLEDIEKPDRLIFDLDPDLTVPWPNVIAAARELRSRLSDLGLESFAKTSGGKGLHLVVPIQRRHAWPDAKRFCRTMAIQLAADAPERFTANASKAQRHGKIYVDYLRNDRGATAVAPYSTRNRPRAPVATPIGWKEVSAAVHPDHFNVEIVPERLAALKSDPWKALTAVRQSLTQKIFHQVGIK